MNMLCLWFFGKDLEDIWGTRRFLQFYFFCGVGAGVVVVLANYLFSDPRIPTVGASGAIFGVLLVAAVLWPDRIIIFYIFPIKLKYLVMILGAIEFFGLRDLNSGVSQRRASERNGIRVHLPQDCGIPQTGPGGSGTREL